MDKGDVIALFAQGVKARDDCLLMLIPGAPVQLSCAMDIRANGIGSRSHAPYTQCKPTVFYNFALPT
jgi:hypothetical protein